MRIGSHVAVAGGLVKVGLAEAAAVGAEIIQLFAGNPRSWIPAAIDPSVDEAFRAACAERDLPVVVHAPHLINLCSPSDLVLSRSTAALEFTMQRAASLGASAVVVHAGSLVTKGRRAEVLRGLRDLVVPIAHRWHDVLLLIEPTAGAGEAAASTIDSSMEYLDALADPEIGLCLDTCHLHAAGEELTAIKQVADRVGLIHVNDSRDPAGSRRDRHESLGCGTIGLAALATVLSAVQDVPLLVETPTHGRDVAVLKDMRAAAQLSVVP
ncbi:deoxyribonuclease IV [Kribbella pratensis]|uniref:Endonuclease IV n=1 Tax=Kribbella pratensis TaxID=2512112 RepID=A0A4R8CJC2_9ACTN|nr:deoxyribonuclease IV [Kribbella pratensis]TDW76508.1 endonuclease IV [Kribbella pratensis]